MGSSVLNVSLKKIIDELQLNPVYLPDDPATILISRNEVTRPALPLCGFFGGFEASRISIIGNAECEYLKQLTPEKRRERMSDFLIKHPVAVIYAHGNQVDEYVAELAEQFKVPLLESPEITSALVSSLIFVGLAFIRKSDSLSRHPLLSGIFCASLFASGEYMHTLTPFGVPWGRLAVGQTGWLPIIQSISLFGSYFITFLMILFVFLTVYI